MFEGLTENETRSRCKEALEGLEFWLRRIIDQILSSVYGHEYIDYQFPEGNFLIKKKLREVLSVRWREDQKRHINIINATTLEELIYIVCNPFLYENHFRPVFIGAYPEGIDELRTFLTRLILPRNSLSHANTIGTRDAERVMCYSHDVVDAIKIYYRNKGMQSKFNVPTIISLTDSFGNKKPRGSFGFLEGISFKDNPECHLRTGDVLSLEVEVDPSFPEADYLVKWNVVAAPETGEGKRFNLKITTIHIGEQLSIECRVISKKDWHAHTFWDDRISIYYLVLPPTE